MRFKQSEQCQYGTCREKARIFYYTMKIKLKEQKTLGEFCRFCRKHNEEFYDHISEFFEGDFDPKKWESRN